MRLRPTILLTVLAAPLLCGGAQAITLRVGSTSTSPGELATFIVTIDGISAGRIPVNNAQLDILLDLNVFEPPSNASQACQVADRFARLAHTETLPLSPPSPAGKMRLRLSVIDTVPPLGDVTDGDFYACSLIVRGDAPLGSSILQATRENVGDTAGKILPVTLMNGMVDVQGEGPAGGGRMPSGGAPQAPPAAVGGGPVPQAARGAAPPTPGMLQRQPNLPGMPQAVPPAPTAATSPSVGAEPTGVVPTAGTAAPAPTAATAAPTAESQPTKPPTQPTVAATATRPAKPKAVTPSTPTAAEEKRGCQLDGAGIDGKAWLLMAGALGLTAARRTRRRRAR